jgi:methylated-DNA-[protein]-cysteine S-methyltransferase
MTRHGFTLFETTIGRCGIAWGERGIVGVQLPETRESATRTRLLRRFPDAQEMPPPPAIQQAIDGIVALLHGEPADLSDVPLDMNGLPELHRQVYEVARTIPPGQTLSYGEIAARLDNRGLAREVGQALGQNPFAIVVPCHRVVTSDGRLGGFSASGGVQTKLRMLAIEGAPMAGTLPLFDEPGTPGFEPRIG